MKHRVLVDCDNTLGLPGKPIDDGQTLLYLLGRPDIELMGITTSFGNGTIEEVRTATERFRRDYGLDIPVYHGAGQRGQRPAETGRFLAETAAAYPGQISLLAIGPVGNLAAAAEIDPLFFRNLKQIACMGGYLRPLDVPGWEHVGEVNLAADPEASFTVLHASCPFTLMNAHTCLQAPFGLEELAPLEKHDPYTYHLMREFLLVCQARHVNPRDYLWDLLPAVYISYPELFDANPVWVASTVADLETGMIVPGSEGNGVQINMPTRILDVERFYQVLYEAWNRAPVSQGGKQA